MLRRINRFPSVDATICEPKSRHNNQIIIMINDWEDWDDNAQNLRRTIHIVSTALGLIIS